MNLLFTYCTIHLCLVLTIQNKEKQSLRDSAHLAHKLMSLDFIPWFSPFVSSEYLWKRYISIIHLQSIFRIKYFVPSTDIIIRIKWVITPIYSKWYRYSTCHLTNTGRKLGHPKGIEERCYSVSLFTFNLCHGSYFKNKFNMCIFRVI